MLKTFREMNVFSSWASAALLSAALLGCAPTRVELKPQESRAHKGYNLMLDATACWLGGIWMDAEGRPAQTRKEDVHARCESVVEQVYGKADKVRQEQLSAQEATTMADLVATVQALSAQDPAEAGSREALTKLVRMEAAAVHEELYARRAADRVKMDLDQDRREGKLRQDELDAVPALRADKELRALLSTEMSPYSHEAQAIGLMLAMGRMEMARGLPKHLKVYAVSGIYQFLFDVPPPEFVLEPTKPLPPGAWLSYLTEAAFAVRYPVPDTGVALLRREQLAWNGLNMAFADKLRAEEGPLASSASGNLSQVVRAVVSRLEGEYHSAQRGAQLSSQP